MNLLVIPTTDWIRHPVPSRHHFIFERLGKKHNVYVIHFNVFPGRRITREPRNVQLIELPTFNSNDLVTFYVANSPLHCLHLQKLIRELEIDVVFSSQLLHGLAGAFLGSKINHRLCVYDLCDYFPESASIYYAGKSYVFKRAVEAAVFRLMQMDLNLSDICTAPSMPLVRVIKAVTGNGQKGHLIPNGVDTELFRPMNRDEDLCENFGISEHAIGFVGSIEGWLDFNPVLEGLRALEKEFADIQLVLIGSSIKTNYYLTIKERANQLNVGNRIIDVGTVPYEHLPRFLSTLRACLIPFRTDLLLTRVALPNKFFEYMACGKPVLATALPELTRVAKDNVFFYHTTTDFIQKAKGILSGQTFTQDTAKSNRDIAMKFDWSDIASQLVSLMTERG